MTLDLHKEEFIDPEEGETPSGRKPIEKVAEHPNPNVRRKAVEGMRRQMEKEYGGKWKARTKDPAIEEETSSLTKPTKEQKRRLMLLQKLERMVKAAKASSYQSDVAKEDVSYDEYLDEAKLSRTARRSARAGKPGYDAKGKPVPKTQKRKVKFEDIDDTLVTHPKDNPDTAKIHYTDKNTGEHIASIFPDELPDFTPPSRSKVKYDDFEDAEKFEKTTKPIPSVIRNIGSRKRKPENLITVTARPRHTDATGGNRRVIKALKKMGVPVTKATFAGNMRNPDGSTIPGTEKKRIITRHIGKKILPKPGSTRDPSAQKVTVDTYDDHGSQALWMAGPSAEKETIPNSHRRVGPTRTKAFQVRPTTRQRGTNRPGTPMAIRLGNEGRGGNTGIRKNTLPSSERTTERTQKRGKTARRGMVSSSFDYELLYDFLLEQLIIEEIAESYEDASIIIDNLNDELLEDLVYQGYEFIHSVLEEETIMQEEMRPRIDYISPYKKIQEKREIKKDYLSEELELTPYEYWKSFIGDEETEEVVSEELDENEVMEEVEMTSYEKWKRVLEEV